MTVFAVLATGPSLCAETVARLRGRCGVIAVSNAYVLAPWADALVSHDARWWMHYREGLEFKGRKFCGQRGEHARGLQEQGVETFRPDYMPVGCNSGLMGMYVAQAIFGATRILMCGFDMHGEHFFGRHAVDAAAPPDLRLRNTSAPRRQEHLRQFGRWRGCEVLNCTPGSAISTFPRALLDEVLP